ncbi:hypothetical protein EI94DRAFT_1027539 [Lactarius quietus]|nr:hypothetical protein EI94DRAFT_1027539 [Lactarius quietus]
MYPAMSPIKVIERADVLKQEAQDIYEDYEHVMIRDRKVAMDKMSDARSLRCDTEGMIWPAQVEKAKRYLSSALEVFRTVKSPLDDDNCCPREEGTSSSPVTTPLSSPIETIPSHLPSGEVSISTASKIPLSSRKKHVTRKARDYSGSYARAPINTLPDDVLLEIFAFCKMDHDAYGFLFRPVLEWRRLIHVCRRWRYIVFAFPRQLDLQLLCTHGTPVSKNLRHWPALIPLVLEYYGTWEGKKSLTPDCEDEVTAALEHPNRVRYVRLPVTGSLLGKVADAMQVPFPVLTHLRLSSRFQAGPALPETFLGGSTPHLRVVHLDGVLFPALPTLLLSATDLVDLKLLNIPHDGYVSPDAMVASLRVLVRLEILSIGFQFPTSHLDLD